jgi:hypothetical protein
MSLEINQNPGEAEASMEHPRGARNGIFADAAHPSHVVLPIIRSDA